MSTHRFITAALARVNGKRGWFLILYSVAFFGFGLSYLQFPETPGRRSTFQFLPPEIPLQLACIVWWAAAAAAFVAALRRSPRADRIGFAALVLVLIVWGFIFLVASLAGWLPGAWTSTFTYWTFAGLVMLVATWPNPVHRDLVEPPALMQPRVDE